MPDDILSQEEIEALIKGKDGGGGEAAADAGDASADATAEAAADAGDASADATAEAAADVQAQAQDAGAEAQAGAEASEQPAQDPADSQSAVDAAVAQAADQVSAPPPQPQAQAPAPAPEPPGQVVKTAQFNSLGDASNTGGRNGVELIMDVQLPVAVELGRATMRVREVLALGPGAVVELDKHAGEPVEIVVNNKVVARGEVVVIDENFGVRITEIVNTNDKDFSRKAA